MPRKAITKRPYTRKPKSDKFIVGMVNPSGCLLMFTSPKVHTDYAEACARAEALYLKHPQNKFVVFAKVCTVGAPMLAPKIEEYKF